MTSKGRVTYWAARYLGSVMPNSREDPATTPHEIALLRIQIDDINKNRPEGVYMLEIVRVEVTPV